MFSFQLICDSNYAITAFNARFPGSVHDSTVFRQSHVCRNFERGKCQFINLLWNTPQWNWCWWMAIYSSTSPHKQLLAIEVLYNITLIINLLVNPFSLQASTRVSLLGIQGTGCHITWWHHTWIPRALIRRGLITLWHEREYVWNKLSEYWGGDLVVYTQSYGWLHWNAP